MRSAAGCVIAAAMICMAACGGGGGTTTNAPPPPMPPVLRSGELDASYGAGGFVLLPAGDGYSNMVVAADGSAFITGNSILKLDARGAPDPTFGIAGRVALAASSPLLDAAGNLYVISDLGVAKLDPAGRLVPDFGTAGRVSLASAATFDTLDAMTRDPQGSLFVVGTSGSLARGSPVVVYKLDASGHLDPTFGTAGRREVQTRAEADVRAVALDSAGNVLVAGYDWIAAAGAGPNVVLLIKLGPTGVPIASFGAGGTVLHMDCLSFRGALALLPEASGSFLAVGECHPGTFRSYQAAVLRFDTFGQSQSSFRNAGLELFGATSVGGVVSESQEASAVGAMGGSIFVAGRRMSGRACDEAGVAKLDSSGQHVASFGEAGKVIIGGLHDVRALGFDAAGRVYVGGPRHAQCPSGGLPSSFAIYRLGG